MKSNREREVGPMRGRMKGRRALVAATCAGLALAASAQIAAGTPTARSNANALSTLKWGILHEIQTLDPALSYDGGGNNLVTYAECDSLLAFGDDLSLQPQIASSWKQRDKLTYVYTLRQDARFWDGKPVTAADVAFSFNRILDPKLASPLQSVVPTVKGMTVTGKWQVTLKLKSPDPRARWVAALPTGQIVEKAFVQKAGKAFGTTPAKTMCSGPYQPTSWVKGQTIALKLVANYWDKAHTPQAKTVTFQTIGDPAAMVAALRSGQLDGTFDLDGRNAGTINGGGLTVATAPGNQIDYISPNLLKGPLQDARVRRALSLAIDRERPGLRGARQVRRAARRPDPAGALDLADRSVQRRLRQARPADVARRGRGQEARRPGRGPGQDRHHRRPRQRHQRHRRPGDRPGGQERRAERGHQEARPERLLPRELQRQVAAHLRRPPELLGRRLPRPGGRPRDAVRLEVLERRGLAERGLHEAHEPVLQEPSRSRRRAPRSWPR